MIGTIVILVIIQAVVIIIIGGMSDNNRDREARLDEIEELLNIKRYSFSLGLNKIQELELLIKDLPHYKAKKAKQKLEEVEAIMKEIEVDEA